MSKRENSDESYILNICDKILKIKGERQRRFDFLRGDSSPKRPKGTPLPVDIYYEQLQLVIEYREKQHYEDVAFFDHKETISNVNRKIQRILYDKRRKEILPLHGIKVIVIPYFELDSKNKRLVRNAEYDEKAIRNILKDIL